MSIQQQEYTFFSSSYGTFTKTGHIQGHKTHLNKLKAEIIRCLPSDHNGIKLEINKKNSGKIPRYLNIIQHMGQRRSLKRNFRLFETK